MVRWRKFWDTCTCLSYRDKHILELATEAKNVDDSPEKRAASCVYTCSTFFVLHSTAPHATCMATSNFKIMLHKKGKGGSRSAPVEFLLCHVCVFSLLEIIII